MTQLFASDNSAPAHPALLSALAAMPQDHAYSYGADSHTHGASGLFAEIFGVSPGDVQILYTANGTGANVIGLSSFLAPWEGVIATHESHITEDECGALEGLRGIKIYHREGGDGKLTPEDCRVFRAYQANIHRNRPGAVSITQSTELGTVYSPGEIRAIGEAAREQEMILHVDGARLANAVAYQLRCERPGLEPGQDGFLARGREILRQMTVDAGVSVVSLGLSKNGGMIGEVLVVFSRNLPERYASRVTRTKGGGELMRSQKQAMQLISKTRYIACQAETLFRDGLWLENAWRANQAARRLGQGIEELSRSYPQWGGGVEYPVQANGVWAVLPEAWIEPLRRDFGFYVWDEQRRVVRLMCSWDTESGLIDAFLSALGERAARG
ncbi:threonine aldolase family protein [Spirochaeta lutea]|uniref:threonine aldolase family protein n=1 Tax=Spirochaeta lutea TaxID=1480694 RepID=UPI00068E7694|nr:beta-eliminating lyase-related protein [Spirochaeta lutea]